MEKAKRSDTAIVLIGIAALGVLLVGALFLVMFLKQGGSSGCVGVIGIDGEITTQGSEPSLFDPGAMGSQDIVQQIDEANSSGNVKALVLVVNSPGGSVVASKEIYDALGRFSKPKVAYIYEMGASGGYYVAAGTQYIVAHPDALTGNIGARATFVDMSGLFEKLGVNGTTVKSGAMKDFGSPMRPMSDDEKQVMQAIVDETFAEFKAAVQKGRAGRLNMEEFEKVLDARILSGRQAKKVGLVDELGEKKDAIRKAAQLAGMEGEGVCELGGRKTKGLFDILSSDSGGILSGFKVEIYQQKGAALSY